MKWSKEFKNEEFIEANSPVWFTKKDVNPFACGECSWKMNTFKSRIMDSIDEGISNLVACPVLVVQKN